MGLEKQLGYVGKDGVKAKTFCKEQHTQTDGDSTQERMLRQAKEQVYRALQYQPKETQTDKVKFQAENVIDGWC